MTRVETVVTVAHQTQVPSQVRRRHNVHPGDVVVWEERPDGDVVLRFRRRYELEDLIGLAAGAAAGDSVRAKRRAQRGGA